MPDFNLDHPSRQADRKRLRETAQLAISAKLSGYVAGKSIERATSVTQ